MTPVELAPFVLPPLLGAVIGYVTNSLAVRMLFRPHRAVQVFGLRLPLTPGVIPRQRAELAQSIARMVARRLLTDDAIGARLRSVDAHHATRRAIVAALDWIADRRLSELHALLRRAAASRGAVKLVEFERTGLAQDLFDALAALRIEDVLDQDRATTALCTLWPRLRAELAARRHDPTLTAALIARTRRVLDVTFSRLTTLQRLFVSAVQYDRQLDARAPEIVDHAIDELFDLIDQPNTPERVAAWLWSRIGSRRFGVLLVGLGIEDGRRLLEFVRSPAGAGSRRQVAVLVDAWLHGRGAHTLGLLLPVLRKRRASIARALTPRVLKPAERIVPTLVRHLDLHALVAGRIDSLEVADVEELLMSVLRRHLKWINVFGALIGALIGGAQVVLSLAW